MYVSNWSRIVATVAFFLIPTGSSIAEVSATLSRQEVISWLRHQESLVRSIECTFDNVKSPTSKENILRVQQVCEEYGGDDRWFDADRYVYTQEQVDRWTCSVDWYREGPK